MIILEVISILAIFIHCGALVWLYTNPGILYTLGFNEKYTKGCFKQIIINLILWVLFAIVVNILCL